MYTCASMMTSAGRLPNPTRFPIRAVFKIFFSCSVNSSINILPLKWKFLSLRAAFYLETVGIPSKAALRNARKAPFLRSGPRGFRKGLRATFPCNKAPLTPASFPALFGTLPCKTPKRNFSSRKRRGAPPEAAAPPQPVVSSSYFKSPKRIVSRSQRRRDEQDAAVGSQGGELPTEGGQAAPRPSDPGGRHRPGSPARGSSRSCPGAAFPQAPAGSRTHR